MASVTKTSKTGLGTRFRCPPSTLSQMVVSLGHLFIIYSHHSLLCPLFAHWAVEGQEQPGSGTQRLREAEPSVGPGSWADPDFIVTILLEPGPAL